MTGRVHLRLTASWWRREYMCVFPCCFRNRFRFAGNRSTNRLGFLAMKVGPFFFACYRNSPRWKVRRSQAPATRWRSSSLHDLPHMDMGATLVSTASSSLWTGHCGMSPRFSICFHHLFSHPPLLPLPRPLWPLLVVMPFL
jgi:hypothetical protein